MVRKNLLQRSLQKWTLPTLALAAELFEHRDIPWESQLRLPNGSASLQNGPCTPSQYKTHPPTVLILHTYLDGTYLFKSQVHGL